MDTNKSRLEIIERINNDIPYIGKRGGEMKMTHINLHLQRLAEKHGEEEAIFAARGF